MPKHILFLLKHAVLGALAAFVFVGLLLWFDVAGLRGLAFASPDGVIALSVMTVLFVITFGSVQMGIAIMGLAKRDTPPSGGHGASEPIVVRIDPRQ